MNTSAKLNRRRFLRTAAACGAAAGGSANWASWGAAPEWQTVFDQSNRVLFFDDYMIESLKNTKFTLNPAVKVSDNPVIRGDRFV